MCLTFIYMYSLSNTKDNCIYRQETEALETINNLPRITQLIHEEVQNLSLCPHSYYETLALSTALQVHKGFRAE